MDITSEKRLRNKQILVIDDDPIVGDLVKRVLKHGDFDNVTVVNSAEKALLALNIPIGISNKKDTSCPFDILIMDIVLPDINGFDLCQRVKSVFHNTPIILISGYDIREIQTKVLSCGADDFMTKPFNTFEMITRVNLLLNKNEAYTDSETVIEENMLRNTTALPDNQIPYIGDKVDSYVILDSIGLGKTSIIYKVIDLNSHDILALKMLTAHSNEFSEIVKRFEFEIKTMSMIDHPNIIKYYNKGKYKKSQYLVMEYLDGVNLEELIISRGRISETLLLDIALDIAGALLEIHSKGIIHRDIKLKNSIYIPISGRVKLCDFGIAQIPNTDRITQDGTIVGTPIYMSPESLNGSDATYASDIYSFGATIYHLATNTPPFVADSQTELYHKQFDDPPIPIEKMREGFSKQWSDLVIKRCLSTIPEKRPRSMKYVLDALAEIKRNIA